MNIYSAVVAVFAIWAVVRITQHWFAGRRNERADSEAAQQKQKMEQLESRVRTLERLITDDRESLARKFDDL